jgi:hypothetical protein
MISLRDDFEQEPDEPCVPADDIEFWKDVFSVLLPPAEESSDRRTSLAS